MKWPVLILFGAAFCMSLVWIDAAERQLTRPQRTMVGAIALTGWILVIVLGSTIL
jgi:hypothetical protein